MENLNNGPKGALRWHVVLRNCNTNGVFDYGNNGISPATPVLVASGGTATNTSAYPVSVTITGGTGVKVNGSSVTTPHTVTVPAGGTITLTYTTAPSWSWTQADYDNFVSASHANAFQVWSPVAGSAGLEMINQSLSYQHPHGTNPNNTPYVLDDSAFGGSGAGALAFPENDGLNQQLSIIGCTQPVTQLNTGYQLCP